LRLVDLPVPFSCKYNCLVCPKLQKRAATVMLVRSSGHAHLRSSSSF
jgi:hypothetical protein